MKMKIFSKNHVFAQGDKVWRYDLQKLVDNAETHVPVIPINYEHQDISTGIGAAYNFRIEDDADGGGLYADFTLLPGIENCFEKQLDRMQVSAEVTGFPATSPSPYLYKIDYSFPDVTNAHGQPVDNPTPIPYPNLPANGKENNFLWVKNGFAIIAPSYLCNNTYNKTMPYYAAYNLYTYIDGVFNATHAAPIQCYATYYQSNILGGYASQGSFCQSTSKEDMVGLTQSTFIHEKNGGINPRAGAAGYLGVYYGDGVTMLAQEGANIRIYCDIRGGTATNNFRSSINEGTLIANEEEGTWNGYLSTQKIENSGTSNIKTYPVEYTGWMNDWQQIAFDSQKDSTLNYSSDVATPNVYFFNSNNSLKEPQSNTLDWHNSNGELIEMAVGGGYSQPRFYNETHSNFQQINLPGGLSLYSTNFNNVLPEYRSQMFKQAGFIFAQFLVYTTSNYTQNIWCIVDPDTFEYTQYTNLTNRTPAITFARLDKCLPGEYGVYLAHVGTFAYDANVFFTPGVRYDCPSAPDTVQRYRDGIGCGITFVMSENIVLSMQPPSEKNTLEVRYCCFDDTGIMTEISETNTVTKILGTNPTYRYIGNNASISCYRDGNNVSNDPQRYYSADCNIALNGFGAILANKCTYSNGNPQTGTITKSGFWCYIWKGTWLSENHQDIVGEHIGVSWFGEMAFVSGKHQEPPSYTFLMQGQQHDLGTLDTVNNVVITPHTVIVDSSKFIAGESKDFTQSNYYQYGLSYSYGSNGFDLYGVEWDLLYHNDNTGVPTITLSLSNSTAPCCFVALRVSFPGDNNATLILFKPGNNSQSAEVISITAYDSTITDIVVVPEDTYRAIPGVRLGTDKYVGCVNNGKYDTPVNIELGLSSGYSISNGLRGRALVIYQNGKMIVVDRYGNSNSITSETVGAAIVWGHYNTASNYLTFSFTEETNFRIFHNATLLDSVVTTNTNVGSSYDLFYSANDNLLLIDGVAVEPVYPLTSATANFRGNYIIYQHSNLYDLYYKTTPVIEDATSLSVTYWAEDYAAVSYNNNYALFFKGLDQNITSQVTALTTSYSQNPIMLTAVLVNCADGKRYLYSRDGLVGDSTQYNIPANMFNNGRAGYVTGSLFTLYCVFNNFEVEYIAPIGTTVSSAYIYQYTNDLSWVIGMPNTQTSSSYDTFVYSRDEGMTRIIGMFAGVTNSISSYIILYNVNNLTFFRFWNFGLSSFLTLDL